MTMGSKSGKKTAISLLCKNLLNHFRWTYFFEDAFFDYILSPIQKSTSKDGIWDSSYSSLKFSPSQMDWLMGKKGAKSENNVQNHLQLKNKDLLPSIRT